MARLFDGTDQRGAISKAYLSSSAGPFTIALWVKPASAASGAEVPLSCGAAHYWQVDWDSVDAPDSLTFFAQGYSGTDPRTDSAIPFTAADLAAGAFCAWRYRGAGAEWSKWKNGEKTVIDAAITFSPRRAAAANASRATSARAPSRTARHLARVASCAWSAAGSRAR